jgi:hypothetical protein
LGQPEEEENELSRWEETNNYILQALTLATSRLFIQMSRHSGLLRSTPLTPKFKNVRAELLLANQIRFSANLGDEQVHEYRVWVVLRRIGACSVIIQMHPLCYQPENARTNRANEVHTVRISTEVGYLLKCLEDRCDNVANEFLF